MDVDVANEQSEPLPVAVNDVRDASGRIAGFVRQTPLVTNEHIDLLAGCWLTFKCENLQVGGAFKVRGAANAMLAMDPAALGAGVATHSSGNHAAALSLVAHKLGVPAYVVMPENASAAKVAVVRQYGGHIDFCAPTIAAREAGLAAVCARTGALAIVPFDDPLVIAGQGTCALELVNQLDYAPDCLVVPVGGGGLISGCGVVSKALWQDTLVFGAEPAGADYGARSLASGILQPQVAPRTIADGLRAALGWTNFRVIQNTVHHIHTAEDDAIIEAMRLAWTHLKLVIEPSAAIGLAAVMQHPQSFSGKRVCVVLTGGNVDIDALPWS